MSTGVTVTGGAERFVNMAETVTAVALRGRWPRAPRTRHPARADVRTYSGPVLPAVRRRRPARRRVTGRAAGTDQTRGRSSIRSIQARRRGRPVVLW